MQSARSKAIELLSSPNASLRRSAAEILGRIGIGSELTLLLRQIEHSYEDRTLSHSLIYALIEGVPDQPLIDALRNDVQAKRIFPSTVALVRILDHRGKLDTEHSDLILQMALGSDQETSSLGLGILDEHPQWSQAILATVSERIQKSKLPPSDPLLALLARWSDNPTIANWVAENILADVSNDWSKSLSPKLLSYLGSKAVPDSWLPLIAKRIVPSSGQEASAWQSALQNRLWKGDAQVIQRAIGSKMREVVSSDLAQDSRTAQVLKWVLSLPQGSSVEESIERVVLLQAFALESQAEPETQSLRRIAWQCLSNIRLEAESSREWILSQLAKAGPLELPIAIDAYCKGSSAPQDERLMEVLSALPASKTLAVDGILGKLKDRPADLQRKWKTSLEAWTKPDQDVQDKVLLWLSKLQEGDPKQGFHVFRSSKAACSACHQVGYVGGNVGPILSRIGQSRSRRDLLEAILFPSARLEQAYRSTKVQLQDGEVVQGLVVSESPKELVLQIAADKRRTIEISEIELRESSNVSIMPAGLESQLSLQELSDLIAFLENAK
jgi:putative heme-binding domain-containing protein